MNLTDLITAKKTDVVTGAWKEGTIPRPQWPSKRANAKFYKWGPSYRWRIVTLSVLGAECRILLLLNQTKQIFRASFGITRQGDTTVLCDYEFHASEPGWHCHARCDDIADIENGTNRFGSVRLPKAGSHHRRDSFEFRRREFSEEAAFRCSVEFFRLDKSDGSLL